MVRFPFRDSLSARSLGSSGFGLAAILLFVAGVRVVTRMDLGEGTFLVGLLLVIVASLQCAGISIRLSNARR